MVTAIAISVVVIFIPIGATATIDTAIRTRCHCRHIWAPIGGVVVAPPLMPLGATDQMAAALTTTHNGTAAATSMATAATATVMEEEECDGCDGADP